MPKPRNKEAKRPNVMQLSIPHDLDKGAIERGLEQMASEIGLIYNGSPSKSALVVAIAQLPPSAKQALVNLLRANC